MSWDDLRELHEAGWEIGSHTCSHLSLPTLGDAELLRELTVSREFARRRSARRVFRRPTRTWEEREARLVGEAGYSSAGSLSGRFQDNSPLHFPRVGVYHGDGIKRFALKVTPVTRWFRSSRTWGRVDAVRRRRRRRADAV